MKFAMPSGRDDLVEIHREMIVPNFPPDERGTAEELVEGVATGQFSLWAARSDGDWTACAVVEHFAEPTMVLLCWLAVRNGQRGSGVGGALLDHVLAELADAGITYTLAEIEDPALPVRSDEYGDPGRRARFYAERGWRALPLPYLQPSVGPGFGRPPLMLIVISGAGPAGGSLPTAPLRNLLMEYLGLDDETLPGLLELLAGEEIATVPVDADAFLGS